jgi:hypothetical protein
MKFALRPESFCIHRLPPGHPVDLARLKDASWYSVTRTSDELSIVAPEGFDPGPGDRQPGWSCLQIAGPLDLAMVGVIAAISRVLADARVSLFAISTHDTDYILVRKHDLETAIRALTAAGHVVTSE